MSSKFVFLRENAEERVIIICPLCGKSRDWKEGEQPVNTTTDAICTNCRAIDAMVACIDCGRILPVHLRWVDDDGIRCSICNYEHQRQTIITMKPIHTK